MQCPICKFCFRKFLPYGRTSRTNALCPKCLALERHRLLWIYLNRKTAFFSKFSKILHIAPELCFINRFKKMENLEYITADIESPLAQVKMDIHAIPFKKNSFDIIFCNHVLEHVDDDLKAMSEIYRIMKSGSWAILQVPFFFPIPKETLSDPTVKDPKERERLFGQNDHVRLYGEDYPQRLESVGFEVDEILPEDFLSKEEIIKYAIRREEIIYIAKKDN